MSVICILNMFYTFYVNMTTGSLCEVKEGRMEEMDGGGARREGVGWEG